MGKLKFNIQFKYPLVWPDNEPQHNEKLTYPRTPEFERTLLLIIRDAKILGISRMVISSNHLIQNLHPVNYNNRGHGITVFFRMQGKDYLVCQDRFSSLAGNLHSVAQLFAGYKIVKRSRAKMKEYDYVTNKAHSEV